MQTKETDRINARVQHDVKVRAQIELEKNGLTISEYLRIVLTSVANNGLPEHFAQPKQEVVDSIMETTDAMTNNKSLSGGTSKEAFERSLRE